jgi:hypothetical protein
MDDRDASTRDWTKYIAVSLAGLSLVLSFFAFLNARAGNRTAEQANRNAEDDRRQLNAQYVFLDAKETPKSQSPPTASNPSELLSLQVFNRGSLPVNTVLIEVRKYPRPQNNAPLRVRLDKPWNDSHFLYLDELDVCSSVHLANVDYDPVSWIYASYVHYVDSVGRRWVRSSNGGTPLPDEKNAIPATIRHDPFFDSKPTPESLPNC